MKKLSLLLSVFALFAALAMPAYAEKVEVTKEEAITAEAKRIYYGSLYSAGRSSFAGYCGLMVSHQLWHMNINESLIVNDGNRHFDYYKDKKVSSGGYYITAYPATEYTLKDALNAITLNGRRDAYNLLVGFQWTNTEAGHRYGHACVINAILDGTVYFVESFYTSIGGREGNIIKCSIEEFAAYFDDWTVFEGIINFGTGQYADACTTYDTDLLVRTRFETTLRSQPCLVGENACVSLRTASAGELLRVTGVCIDPATNMQYYRVEDGEGTAYVSVGTTGVVQCLGEFLTLSKAKIPTHVKTGKSFSVSGEVSAGSLPVSAVEIVVTDRDDKVVLRHREKQETYSPNISVLNGELATQPLKSGIYKVQIYASAACKYISGGVLETQPAGKLLYEQLLLVGERPANLENWKDLLQPEETVKDGWILQDGAWYCYREGEPLTGWVQEFGVLYYMDETGKATTGWAEVEGAKRYFSSTGALCTGWLTTEEGRMYLPETGGMAAGWQIIDNCKYFFDDNRLLVTGGVLKDGKNRYEIQPDGRAVRLIEEK